MACSHYKQLEPHILYTGRKIDIPWEPNFLYPANLFFKKESNINICSYKQKAERITSRPALQELIK